MEERISEGNRDQKGIEYIPPGVRGELEPFMRAHTAHFVSMIMAAGFRRGRAGLRPLITGPAKASGCLYRQRLWATWPIITIH